MKRKSLTAKRKVNIKKEIKNKKIKDNFNKFKKIQFSSQYKKKKSHFIIKNDFTKKTIDANIRGILKQIKQ